DNPEPVLVTRLPARSSNTVQPARNVEKRWSIFMGRKGWMGGKGWTVGPIRLSCLSRLSCLVRRRRSGRLEGEGDVLRPFWAGRDGLSDRAKLFVPGLDRVRPRRQIVQRELSVVLRHGEVRVIEHADVRVHPAVDVAFERHHYLPLREGVHRLHALDRL